MARLITPYYEIAGGPMFEGNQFFPSFPTSPPLDDDAANPYDEEDDQSTSTYSPEGCEIVPRDDRFKYDWDETSSEILISTRLKMNEDFEKAQSYEEQQKLWSEIESELLAAGYSFLLLNIIHRWECEFYEYKVNVNSLSVRDQPDKNWTYFEAMDRVFKYSTEVLKSKRSEADSTAADSSPATKPFKLSFFKAAIYSRIRKDFNSNEWDDRATKILILNRLRMNGDFERAQNQQERDKLWSVILNKLLAAGYTFVLLDLKQHWELQDYIYRTNVTSLALINLSDIRWEHFAAMDSVFQCSTEVLKSKHNEVDSTAAFSSPATRPTHLSFFKGGIKRKPVITFQTIEEVIIPSPKDKTPVTCQPRSTAYKYTSIAPISKLYDVGDSCWSCWHCCCCCENDPSENTYNRTVEISFQDDEYTTKSESTSKSYSGFPARTSYSRPTGRSGGYSSVSDGRSGHRNDHRTVDATDGYNSDRYTDDHANIRVFENNYYCLTSGDIDDDNSCDETKGDEGCGTGVAGGCGATTADDTQLGSCETDGDAKAVSDDAEGCCKTDGDAKAVSDDAEGYCKTDGDAKAVSVDAEGCCKTELVAKTESDNAEGSCKTDGDAKTESSCKTDGDAKTGSDDSGVGVIGGSCGETGYSGGTDNDGGGTDDSNSGHVGGGDDNGCCETGGGDDDRGCESGGGGDGGFDE